MVTVFSSFPAVHSLCIVGFFCTFKRPTGSWTVFRRLKEETMKKKLALLLAALCLLLALTGCGEKRTVRTCHALQPERARHYVRLHHPRVQRRLGRKFPGRDARRRQRCDNRSRHLQRNPRFPPSGTSSSTAKKITFCTKRMSTRSISRCTTATASCSSPGRGDQHRCLHRRRVSGALCRLHPRRSCRGSRGSCRYGRQ